MSIKRQDHEKWMRVALQEAEKAFYAKEVPVGAVVVKDNLIIGRGYNQCEGLHDPTAHAEIIAITSATNTLKDWRLTGCSLYVTKEPCPMCAGALLNARVNFMGFGMFDEQEGCCGSLYQLCGDPRFSTTVAVKGGVLEKKCLGLIQEFFQLKRSQ